MRHFPCKIVVKIPALPLMGLLAVLLFPLEEAAGLTISEIHYHPPGFGDESRKLEFIEIYNEDPDPLDLSGYSFSKGVTFFFSTGTFLEGRSYLVVCADENTIRGHYGIQNVLGNWSATTSLDNSGDTIAIANSGGAVVAEVDFNDRGRWPAGTDGTGHTLALKEIYSDMGDPENWALSREIGGTPGGANFPSGWSTEAVVINEALIRTNGTRWVELYNLGPAIVDLSGYYLTDDPEVLAKSRIANNTSLAPGTWLAFEETALGLNFSLNNPILRDRVFVALVDSSGARVVDAFTFKPIVEGASVARIPDGNGEMAAAADPTRGARNQVTVERNIVINEIHYHPSDEDPGREFIELFNRGGAVVDLAGWQFTDGIQFTFPANTELGPRQYLVVARDPARIRSIYGLPENQVLGPAATSAQEQFGSLRDAGERVTLVDGRGNVADTVRYHDGGEWPFWADGGGASLELIDPQQENDTPQAWDASDDSQKARAISLEYKARLLPGQGSESEIHVMLLGKGIALVDDLYIPGDKTTTVIDDTVYSEIGDSWRYFKGTVEPSAPVSLWREVEFDDSSWLEGALPIGYGESGIATTLADMRFSYFSVFLRKRFEVPDTNAVDRLLLQIDYDDGYVAYLNGAEVSRGDLEGNPPAHYAPAATSRESGTPLAIDLTSKKGLLRNGANVLTIQVHNNTINSPDCFLSARFFSGKSIDIPAGWNMVSDGDFEAPLDSEWLIYGTHDRSGRTDKDPISGLGSLKIVATGAGDEKVNHIERELARTFSSGKEYTVSLKARWIIGSQSLLTMADTFGLGRSHALLPPENVGTPGAVNGVTLRQADREGEANLGPVIDQVGQSPIVPGGQEKVNVGARILDSDGVASATLRYAIDSPAATFIEIPMSGPEGGGYFTAQIPGQALGTRVLFEIIATDTRGHPGRYPLDHLRRTHPLILDPANPGPADHRWAIYRHEVKTPSTPYHVYRFWMHKLNEEYLSSRPVHADDLVEGSFVYGSTSVYHGSGLRFQGSALSRAGWAGNFRVSMPSDRPLHGRTGRFNLDVDGLNIRDRLINHIIRNNTNGQRVPFNTHALVHFTVNTRTLGTRVHIAPPGKEFLNLWFPEDHGGELFEIDERYNFSDGGLATSRKNAQWLYPPYTSEGTGDNKESYRFYFSLRSDEDEDNYDHLIQTARILTPAITPAGQFDAQIFNHLNVEEFLRVLSIRQNTADVDTWACVYGRSAYLYRPEQDGRWWLFPWDSDKSFFPDNPPVLPLPSSPSGTIENGFPEFKRLINRPRIKRIYYGILKEMVDRHFSSTYLKPYTDRWRAMGATNDSLALALPGGWIDQRAARIRQWIEPAVYPQRRLTIATNNGNPFSTGSSLLTLTGSAPAEIVSILALVNDLYEDAPVVEFSSSDFFGWTLAGLPLTPGINTINLFGFNSNNDLVDTASIQVLYSLIPGAFLRGDADGDLSLSISDPVKILLHMFRGDPVACQDAMDVDDNGFIEVADAIHLLNFMFLRGLPPLPPYPQAGQDTSSGDALTCGGGS